MMRCHDDLQALTKFVTWDIHERSAGALQRSLPDQTDIVEIYQVAVKAAEKEKDSKQQPIDEEYEETETKKITKTITKPKPSKGELNTRSGSTRRTNGFRNHEYLATASTICVARRAAGNRSLQRRQTTNSRRCTRVLPHRPGEPILEVHGGRRC